MTFGYRMTRCGWRCDGGCRQAVEGGGELFRKADEIEREREGWPSPSLHAFRWMLIQSAVPETSLPPKTICTMGFHYLLDRFVICEAL